MLKLVRVRCKQMPPYWKWRIVIHLHHRNPDHQLVTPTRTTRQTRSSQKIEGLKENVDQQSMEAKIAKTEDSILKLDRHLNNRTCAKSLQHSAKANIAPDSTFQKEIKDIKQTAEQALVNALTRFHKRRLNSLRNKLESRPTLSSRRRTHVNRQSRSESQSASNIVNNDNVKLAELEKRIIDLTNIVSTHVISTNKRVESYNIVFSEPSATTTNHFKSNCLLRNQRCRMLQKNATHRRQTTQRETNEKFLKKFFKPQTYWQPRERDIKGSQVYPNTRDRWDKNQASTLARFWTVCKTNAPSIHISRWKQRSASVPC